MITTESADGHRHEFPDETQPEVVDRVMKQYAESRKDKTTNMENIATGFMDPIEGGAQLLAKITPKPVENVINAVNNWLADKTGLVAKLPEGGMQEHAQQREAEIEKRRGPDAGVNWGRLTGNLLNPANFAGAGLASAVPGLVGRGVLRGMGQSAVTGGVVGALQPATNSDFWTEKALQTGGGALIGAGTVAAGSAAGSIVDAVARKTPQALESQAVQTVLRRISEDEKAGGPSATDLLDLFNKSRQPVVLADIGEANTKALGGQVSRKPGPARAFVQGALDKRDKKAAERVSRYISSLLSKDSNAYEATESLLESRTAAAKPSYDNAYDLAGVWSPRLEEFFGDPTIMAGLQRGYELERMQALARGAPLKTTQLGVELDTEGNVHLMDKPNMRLLDIGKQGLDAIVSDERDALTGRLTAKGRAINDLRKAYVQEIDNLDVTGKYKRARQEYAGFSKSLDAVKLGQKVFHLSPQENAATVDSMTPSELQFYRLGVADLLRERLAKTGFTSDEAKSIIKNPWMRDQLRPAFRSTRAFNLFVDAVADESKMFTTRGQTLGGSQTASRMAEDMGGDTAMHAADLAHKTATGHWFSAISTAYKMYRDLGVRPNPELNEKIARILFSPTLSKEMEQGMRAGNEITELVGGKKGPLKITVHPKERAAPVQGPTPAGAAVRGAASGLTVPGAVDYAHESEKHSGGIPGYAQGGTPAVGRPIVVGEQGPETLVPGLGSSGLSGLLGQAPMNAVQQSPLGQLLAHAPMNAAQQGPLGSLLAGNRSLGEHPEVAQPAPVPTMAPSLPGLAQTAFQGNSLGSLLEQAPALPIGGTADWLTAYGRLRGYAEGGQPPTGEPIVVGEDGPEVIQLNQPGTVIPNPATQAQQAREAAAGRMQRGMTHGQPDHDYIPTITDFIQSVPTGAVETLMGLGSRGGQAAQIEMGQPVDVPDPSQAMDSLQQGIGQLHQPSTPAGGMGKGLGNMVANPVSYMLPGAATAIAKAAPKAGIVLSALTSLGLQGADKAVSGEAPRPEVPEGQRDPNAPEWWKTKRKPEPVPFVPGEAPKAPERLKASKAELTAQEEVLWGANKDDSAPRARAKARKAASILAERQKNIDTKREVDQKALDTDYAHASEAFKEKSGIEQRNYKTAKADWDKEQTKLNEEDADNKKKNQNFKRQFGTVATEVLGLTLATLAPLAARFGREKARKMVDSIADKIRKEVADAAAVPNKAASETIKGQLGSIGEAEKRAAKAPDYDLKESPWTKTGIIGGSAVAGALEGPAPYYLDWMGLPSTSPDLAESRDPKDFATRVGLGALEGGLSGKLIGTTPLSRSSALIDKEGLIKHRDRFEAILGKREATAAKREAAKQAAPAAQAEKAAPKKTSAPAPKEKSEEEEKPTKREPLKITVHPKESAADRVARQNEENKKTIKRSRKKPDQEAAE